MEITLASDQERPNLFAEIRVDGQPYADVIYDNAKEAYQLTIYPAQEGEWIVLDLAEFRKALLKAKDALVGRGFPNLRV